jgi:hypothetical protein
MGFLALHLAPQQTDWVCFSIFSSIPHPDSGWFKGKQWVCFSALITDLGVQRLGQFGEMSDSISGLQSDGKMEGNVDRASSFF